MSLQYPSADRFEQDPNKDANNALNGPSTVYGMKEHMRRAHEMKYWSNEDLFIRDLHDKQIRQINSIRMALKIKIDEPNCSPPVVEATQVVEVPVSEVPCTVAATTPSSPQASVQTSCPGFWKSLKRKVEDFLLGVFSRMPTRN